MEFTNFTELVKNEVGKKAGDGYKVQTVTEAGNNGTVLTGLVFLQKGYYSSPAIYLEDYYREYTAGTATLDMITDSVMDAYRRNRSYRGFNIGNILDYGTARHHIVYKLVNTERNSALLGEIPSVPFHDLSIVFEYLIPQESTDTGAATILVNNAHMKIWGVSVDELYKEASANTPVLQKYVLEIMGDVLEEMVPGSGDVCGAVPLYVLTNERKCYGAAGILYPRLLRDFAKASRSDLFVIPSSVHEMLLMPHADPADSEDIKRIIQESNKTLVDAEDVLSDSLYFYEACTGELRIL